MSLPRVQEVAGDPSTARVIESLGRRSAPCTCRCSAQASLAPALPGVFLPSFSYFQNGALRFWDLPKEALPRFENSQCACNPCSAWISHLACLFPFKQFSLSSILEYLEIPEYQVLRPQIFSVSIMLRALSVNLSSSEVDGDFKD